MDQTKPGTSERGTSTPVEQIQTTLRQVSRRQWWHWSSGVIVTLLLTLCIVTFAFPGLISEKESFYTFNLHLAVRGLVGLVLLFNIYAIQQQLLIHRIEFQLTQQICTLDRLYRVEERTEQVYKIASLDSLTGLYNRQSGELRLAEEMARSQRHARSLTVLMLDLDGLKQVNDTFGHPAGDYMLKYFAERLQGAVRGSDVPIRLGGDEFLVLLAECKLNEVHLVLNRLKGLTTDFEGRKIPLEFAAGWTDYVPGESSQTLMMRADAALYADKRSSKEKREINKTTAESPQPGASLSPREMQVLQLLAQGKSNKEVAGALGISVRTVETHRARIMAELNVHSVSELILYAVRHKMTA